MQRAIKKYHVNILLKRSGVLILFISCNLCLQAQDNELPDTTIKELKYQLDTTAQAEYPTDSIEEEDAGKLNEENKIEQDYFLQKEFTGGIPDTLKFRRLPDNTIKALREDKAFWYANETFKKKEKKKDGTSFTAHPLFQTILWFIIVGGFVTFLILYLNNSNAGLFRKSSNIADEETDAETSDIFTINYQKEIDKAVAISNYRLAVRLMFLRLLRDLSDKNIIQYKQDSTNFDYMMQLHSTNLYSDFSWLARNYEYSWYGQFDIDKEKYSIIKNEFENFERKLNK
ncbi:MAG TPA: hypothetical protein VJ111_12560 [Chitinophagaceae bacterium]|nr:hypothetical protein [Chitinophagaceae bacterium]